MAQFCGLARPNVRLLKYLSRMTGISLHRQTFCRYHEIPVTPPLGNKNLCAQDGHLAECSDSLYIPQVTCNPFQYV